MNLFKKLICAVALAGSFIHAGAETFIGDRTDFRDETIYFAMTTRFYDGDPKNNVLSWDKQDVQISKNDPDWRGDFAGLIQKLDYIKALGFTAIWITPVVQNASGEDYHGYHAMDFSSVDIRYESRKEWGSEKDVKFQDLIDAAHAKGMKIILDIVLNHTGNFGEAHLNPLFTRSQNIRNQASVSASLIPNYDRMPSNYNDLDGNAQYQARFKFFKNPQYDKHNYYHHYGTGWNWDLPNRWWGQIAGDCVDLNTENNTVAEYLVKCYGKFIEMGVDGFRIDTTGHISRLTFNKQFIPQFLAIAENFKDKRLNGCPFFMFGECCARLGEVIYRGQHNLSSHFYTWKSDAALLKEYNGTQAFWDTQKLNEGHDSPVGPMIVCEKESAFDKSSDNVFMKNGAWHEPDYSQYSGFSVIDFPMHYNFVNAASAVNIAKQGDKYYNDASFNVVYVDSHDYSPQPNDNIRFSGGTAQWAENLSLMFTFRGIPCVYYGSEVEFKKGLPIDVGGENNKTPRCESGRAYFGEYLKGDVSASDFGVYTASGNVSTTLGGDLAQHIIRLNKIRAAVPALRKGQYTWDGCSAKGGWAFKRAYKDSYALVAINGGATFSNLPAGTYIDIVTGESYNATANGSITVSAPQTQGQLRVIVKDWKGGIIGEDGKFIYKTSPVAKGGNPKFDDPGTTEYYTAKDAVGTAAVVFSPAGGSFKTETIDVKIALNSEAKSGWFKAEGGNKVNLQPGKTESLSIGNGMNYGQSFKVEWSASDGAGTYTGTVSYRKVDPNASITIYVKADNAPYLYAWSGDKKFNGEWPGKKMSQTKKVGNVEYYYQTFPDTEEVNVIFNNGNGSQTSDIKGITSDAYFTYNGGTSYKEVSNPENPDEGNSDNADKKDITVFVNATSAPYLYVWSGDKKLNGEWPGKKMSEKTTVEGVEFYYQTFKEVASINVIFNDGNGNQTGNIEGISADTYFKYDGSRNYDILNETDEPDSGNDGATQPSVPSDGKYTIFFDNSETNWNEVYSYITEITLGEEIVGAWPGLKGVYDATSDYYKFSFTCNYADPRLSCVFHNNSNNKTSIIFVGNNGVYSNSSYLFDFDNPDPENPGNDEDEGNKNPDETLPGGDENGISDAEAHGIKVWSYEGVLFIHTDYPADIVIYRLDGTARTINLESGTNIIPGLQHGFYIINGQKIII